MNTLFKYKSVLLVFFACLQTSSGIAQQVSTDSYVKFINPIIGTAGHNTVYPGVSMPFGMVQLSPDTRVNVDKCLTYIYSDTSIIGFNHIHHLGILSSGSVNVSLMPGIGSLGDLRGDSTQTSGYKSAFSHTDEFASAGYYSVFLNTYGIKAELTSTERVGFSRYTFPVKTIGHIMLTLGQSVGSIKTHLGNIELLNRTTVRGFEYIGLPSSQHKVYFTLVFSKPYKSAILYANGQIQKLRSKTASAADTRAEFIFRKAGTVLAKISLSMVDQSGAEVNLKAELPGWNFDSLKNQSATKWDHALSGIKTEGNVDSVKTLFYTALYHCFLTPTLDADADHRYLGKDGKIYTANFIHYDVSSFPDHQRLNYALLDLIAPDRMIDYFHSLLTAQQEFRKNTQPNQQLNQQLQSSLGIRQLSILSDAYFQGTLPLTMTLPVYEETVKLVHDWSAPKPGSLQPENNTIDLPLAYMNASRLAKMLHKTDDYQFFMRQFAIYQHLEEVKGKLQLKTGAPILSASSQCCTDFRQLPAKSADQPKKSGLALYKNNALGLPTADQGVESSAWYVFNAIGIYPLNLSDGNFYFTSPLFLKTTISGNNKIKFVVLGNNNSLPDQYITSALLNNQYLKMMYLASGTLNNGAILKLDNHALSNSGVPSLLHDKSKLIRKIHKKRKNTALSP